MGFQFSKNQLLIASGIAVVLVTAFWLLIDSQTEEAPVEIVRTEEREQDNREQADAIASPERPAQSAFELLEPAPAIDEEGQLPTDWHQLTVAEKIALNPLDCPPDKNDFVHVRADNGRCLESEQADTASEDQPETSPEPSIDQAFLGQRFTYSHNLDVIVSSWVCGHAAEIMNNPILEGSLTNSDAIYQEYDLWNEITQPDNGGRNDAGNSNSERSPNPSQKCRAVLTGINTGSDRYLPDGCGLSFERSVTLVGQQKKYKALPTDRLCTRNTIDFPHGARNQDILFFDIDAKDKMKEIIVSDQLGDKKYSIDVSRFGAINLSPRVVF